MNVSMNSTAKTARINSKGALLYPPNHTKTTNILFIDAVAPKPYTPHTLQTEGMGGTEATVVRVAEELGKQFNVVVAQKRVDIKHFNASYVPLANVQFIPKDTRVVVLRHAKLAAACSPAVNHVFLWLHDLITPNLSEAVNDLNVGDVTTVCVSKFHAKLVQSQVPQLNNVIHAYNPVNEERNYDPLAYDSNKLVFFSSPHKGLESVLWVFQQLRELNPKFKLYIANPGYYPNVEVDMRSVVNLGSLPHHKIMQHVRESLCVLYPNRIYPETFGLVMAEANAVGTPVITYPIGAAEEVLNWYPSQLAESKEEIIQTVMRWWGEQRPLVDANSNFSLETVVNRWKEILGV